MRARAVGPGERRPRRLCRRAWGGAVLGVTVWGSRCPPGRRGPSSLPSRRLPSGPAGFPLTPQRCATGPRPAGSPPAFPLGRLESRGAGRRSGPPLLVRPLAVQVPSAFRRGGLKTPWGGVARPPVGRGRWARRRGSPVVGGVPDPPLASPRTGSAPWPGPRRARVAAAARRGGRRVGALPGGRRRAVARVLRASRCVPRAVGAGTPGRLWGCPRGLTPSWVVRASPRGSETFRPLSGVWFRYLSRWPA